MNKYLILGIVTVVIIVGGILLQRFSGAPAITYTGKTKEFIIIAKKDEWRFIPDVIEVDYGDHVKLTVVNEDDYDHGIGIDGLGVSQRMPANETIVVEFDAIKAGEFPFICSVPCGDCQEASCEVDGVRHGHADMVGTLKVKSVAPTSTTPSETKAN